jgi:hypothetical protein
MGGARTWSVGVATLLALACSGAIASGAMAVTPGWECVPTTAGQPVVSGGAGAAPSCGAGTTAVLAPTYVSSGVGGKPTAEFSAINVQIVSGTGSTSTINGEGNLMIGYDEAPGGQTGSNNLVVGYGQAYSSFGSILGGKYNNASGPWSVVFGDANKTASTANSATVTGGKENTAKGAYSSVSGGFSNEATGSQSSILGGDGHDVTTMGGYFPE